MYSDEYINLRYNKMNLMRHLFRIPFKLIFNLLRYAYQFFQLYPNSLKFSNKIIFFTVSKNNYEALKRLYKPFINQSLFLTNDYRLKNNQYVIPMVIPYLVSIILSPIIFFNVFKLNSSERKRFLLYFEEIIESIGYNYFIKYYLKYLRPRAIIFTNDHVFYSRSLILKANEFRIPTFYMQHSAVTDIFPPMLGKYSMLDGIDSFNKYYPNQSLPNKNVALIGISKFDNYLKNYYLNNNNNNIQNIGIATTDSMDIKNIKLLIHMLKKEFGANKLYFRAHPAEVQKNKYKSLDLDDCNISDSTKESVMNYLKKVDTVISGNSSIILEAAIMNVFPIFWNTPDSLSKYKDNKNDKYGFVKNKLVIPLMTVDEIVNTIFKYKSNKPNLKNKIKIYCDTINTDYEGKSTILARNFINKMLF
tara:strand:- start:1539 stop:2792 length:1254 start_codon:yes stop_codon:yes gene_type:complete